MSGSMICPIRAGCRPGLDCLAPDDPFSGLCRARCDCETGAGCGVIDPDYTCIWEDAGSQRCWCG